MVLGSGKSNKAARCAFPPLRAAASASGRAGAAAPGTAAPTHLPAAQKCWPAGWRCAACSSACSPTLARLLLLLLRRAPSPRALPPPRRRRRRPPPGRRPRAPRSWRACAARSLTWWWWAGGAWARAWRGRLPRAACAWRWWSARTLARAPLAAAPSSSTAASATWRRPLRTWTWACTGWCTRRWRRCVLGGGAAAAASRH